MQQQRKTLRAGELDSHRKGLVGAPEAGMVREPGEEAWEDKLTALRSHRGPQGTSPRVRTPYQTCGSSDRNAPRGRGVLPGSSYVP
ncbi:hypothetical protein OQI_27035 [Streptomyces pharetrae CZA14]|uniref:Uncharacterized protein n=1 Tax=Streptomyces pharetrae CZA14 TaxID=1144883 RepID=A0ABX3YE04_9ACTN|nr:hypothetical protein OQI_27035 [Streptomyces pharetrae CZA14]